MKGMKQKFKIFKFYFIESNNIKAIIGTEFGFKI